MPRPERPVDPEDGEIARFAADLRALRVGAGSPAYRVLARRAHFSAATLSTAASGRKLPSLAVTVAYARACGGDPVAWEARWRSLAVTLATDQPPDRDGVDGAPYVGLAAYQPGDAERFFGRERLVDDVVAAVVGQPFVAVVGPSGSGKSSLLRAGLLPRIGRDGGETGDWPVVLMTPGADPVGELATHLAPLLGMPAGLVNADLIVGPRRLDLCVRQALVGRPGPVRLVLVVDQFEEVFTRCHDGDQRQLFIAALLTAAHATTSRIRVVLGIRADFYGRCAEHAGLVDVLSNAQILVGPMQAEHLRAAITRPASGAGLTVEASLVSTIVAQMVDRPGALPLMSHALVETWRRRRGTTLSLVGYEAAGGLDGAVAQTAEHTFALLTRGQQRAARDILLRLVTVGDGVEDTRRRIGTDELNLQDPIIAHAVDALVAARLVTVGHGSVEIAHEALIWAWPRLRDWLTEDRDGLRIHRQLTEAARTWRNLGRDTGALYRGVQLATVRDWHGRSGTALSSAERDFLDASVAAGTADLRTYRRRTRRMRILTTTLAVLLVLAAAIGGVALRQRQAARGVAAVVLSRELAARAIAMYLHEPDDGKLLALAAFREAPTEEARGALLTVQTVPSIAQLADPTTTTLRSIATSADGRRLAIGNTDGTTVICGGATPLWKMKSDPAVFRHSDGAKIGECDETRWTLDGERPAVLAGNAAPVTSVALSADGRDVAASQGGAVVQRASGSAWVPDSPDPTGDTTAMAFSPDGHALALGNAVGIVTLCHDSGPSSCAEAPWVTHETVENRPIDMPISAIAFSPDERLLATARAYDGTISVWDLASHRKRLTLGQRPGATAIAFSPDGRTLAAGNAYGAVTLWNVGSGDQTAAIDLTARISGTNVLTLAFGPDDHRLLVANSLGGVQMWDTDTGDVVRDLCADQADLITPQRWAGLISEVPFSPPCG